MLDEGVDGHDEKSAGEPQRAEQPHHLQKSQSMQGNEAAEHGHADAAQRNQAIFDFSAGKVAGGEAAEANADGESGLQVAAVGFIEPKNFPSVENNDELQ